MTPMPHPPANNMPTPESLVLDTNVVLDWLLFDDPRCGELAKQIESRQLIWRATAAMREELAIVLPRPQLQAWEGEQVLPRFDRWAQLTPEIGLARVIAPRCRDDADQKFIDLACTLGRCWLLTRDRALLDLSKAARPHGVEVLSPAAWLRRQGNAAGIAAEG